MGLIIDSRKVEWHNTPHIFMADYLCPHCRNPIYDEDALFCHFCGESLQRAGQGFLGNLRYSPQKIWWPVLVLLVLIGLAFWLLR